MPTGSGDRWALDYEAGRPGWPADAVDLVGVPSTATVLEVGAGTGKLTRVLTPAFAQVVAVEPADPMRAILDRMCPDADVRGGTAQNIPLDDGSVDAVFAAEAFHLFIDERAVRELARVLRPDGRLVLMWNLPAGRTEPSIAAAETFLSDRAPTDVSYDPLDLDGPQYTSGKWRDVLADCSFEPLQEAQLPNLQEIDRDGLVAFFASMGWIADLPDDERLPLLDEVRSLLDDVTYRRSWETHVHWTKQGTLDAADEPI
jgi:SAM-dependent methyltransferase